MAIDSSTTSSKSGKASEMFLAHLGLSLTTEDALLLQSAERVLRLAFPYSAAALAQNGCMVRLEFDTDERAKKAIWVRSTGDAQYVIGVPMAFLWKTVQFCRPLCAQLTTFIPIERAVAACLLLMFFHEVAHIVWGHLERTGASTAEYKADEASADYRGGKLFAQCLVQAGEFAVELDLVRPDDRLESVLVGALLFGALMESMPETRLTPYHGPVARWWLMTGGFCLVNEQLGAIEVGRQQKVFERTRQRIIAARLPQLHRLLDANSGEEEALEETLTILDDRVPELLNISPAAAALRKIWGRFTKRSKRRGKPLAPRIWPNRRGK